SVLFSEDFVASAQRSGQYLGKRHRRNCETHKPFVMRLEYRPECRSELGMILEHVNNRGGVNQEKGVLRQPLEAYRFHSSLSRRRVTGLSRPYSPRPLPARGSNERCVCASPDAETGASTATGRPWRVMIV